MSTECIIFYKWSAYNEEVLHEALTAYGYDVVTFDRKCTNYSRDLGFAEELINLVHSSGAAGIISFNYIPIISLVCNVTETTYYSWVYDNPHLPLYAKTVGMECNRIGIFDRGMVEELKGRGIHTAFHLPLATKIAKFEKVITGSSISAKYKSDVSFVGSLYTDEHNYYDMIYSDKSKTSEIDSLIRDCMFKPDISSETEKYRQNPQGLRYTVEAMRNMGLCLGEDYIQKPEEIAISSVFERKITIEERKVLVHKLAGLEGISFALYTGSSVDIPTRGPVNYNTEMPLVFNQSKININLSLRSIHSGISLRLLDIMSCGGFVLSSRQPELTECFEDDKEVALFTTPEECEEKIRYYLKHEEKRKAIAAAGKEKAEKLFSYEVLLPKLLSK